MKWPLAAGLFIAITLAAPLGTIAAGTAPRAIAVSVPPDPVSLAPGAHGVIPIRVSNPGSTAVVVRIKQETIELGNNGATSLVDHPDPLWVDHAFFPAGDITIPADGYRDLTVDVQMPSSIAPDLYYIGFLVSPVPVPGASVTVINQIGAFFIIDVPGARDRDLVADLSVQGFTAGPVHIDDLVVGDWVNGLLTTRNIGPSAVQFFGENDVSSTPFSVAPSQQRIGLSLLPIGRERTMPVMGVPGFPVDLVTLTVTVQYPGDTASSTKEVVLSKTVLVIDPLVIFAVCGVIAATTVWMLYLRHRRRAELRGARRQSRA